jgi:hypothetical protein
VGGACILSVELEVRLLRQSRVGRERALDVLFAQLYSVNINISIVPLIHGDNLYPPISRRVCT